MRKNWGITIIGITSFLWIVPSYAQEKELKVEESAEVSLEAYSDAFQENFFEALKQKGIENYDRAVNLLLKCKQISPNDKVVDYELAKIYLKDRQYISAQEYATSALISDPANLWYLDTYMRILQKQGIALSSVRSSIPYDNPQLRENLASIYFQRKDYLETINILKSIEATTFSKNLMAKAEEGLENEKRKTKTVSYTATVDNTTSSPLERYKVRIEGIIRSGNLTLLETLSSEALDLYPSQPYFYYALGLALNKKMKYKNAVEYLESGLDYMVDNDVRLSNNIYKALVEAYTGLRNTAKANLYQQKIKPGF
ncbi:tetratricopeptide repeat protein [Spongiimicrobium salis]|uniref:tetratricopeptide repeat protein n=1 Tax=Spongiimicrobium salis TaxID=1667022 RepID=UPI00374CDAD1